MDGPVAAGVILKAADTGRNRPLAVSPQWQNHGVGTLGLLERFWSKVDKTGACSPDRPDLGSCWVWLGKPRGERGSGRFVVRKGLVVPAHQWIYEHENGPIPAHHLVERICQNRLCVNPAHCRLVPRNERISRVLAGRAVPTDFRSKMSEVRQAAAVVRTCPCGRRAKRQTTEGWVCVAHFCRWKRDRSFSWERPIKEYKPGGRAKTPRELALQARGITQAEFDMVLAAQGGACALCRTGDPGSNGKFSIDHDHSHQCRAYGCRDCIRGLLCNACNLVLLPNLERGIGLGLVVPDAELSVYLASRPFAKPIMT